MFSRRLIVILSFCALIVVGLTSSSFAAEKVLKLGIKVSDIMSLDPHYSTTLGDMAVIGACFNGLVRYKPGDIDLEKIEPDLAEKWERSPDGLTWTFHLRKGVKFHKGYGELTAEDVKFSLEKASNKSTSGFASDFNALDRIEAIDKYTVKLIFKNVLPSSLGILADYHGGNIVSKKAFQEKGDKFKLDPIGTGPFMFKEHTPKEKVVVTRNPEFFRGIPKLDRVEFWFMPDSTSREMAYRKGELQIAEGDPEQAWINKMKTIPGTKIDVMGPGETSVLHFNMSIKPLNDIRVRRAICYAINRDEIRKFLGADVTEKLISVIPMDYLGGTDKVPTYEFNPDKAKSLLKEAGFPNGLEFSTIISEQSAFRRPYEQIQEQLRRVGINLKTDVIAHTTFHAQIRKDVCPIVLYNAARFPVADSFLTLFYHSKSIVGTPTAVTNFSHYNKIDSLIDSARIELDGKKQKELWADAQKKINEDAVAFPLCVIKPVFARKNNVELGYILKSTLLYSPPITWETDLK